MDRILVVDEDLSLLNKISESLVKLSQFEVTKASEVDAAFEILSKKKISVLVTAIGTSKLDGLELIAYMTRNHPSIPIVVMNDYGKPWFYDHASQTDFLYHIEKPFEFKSLASAVFVGLTLRDEGKHLGGMTVASLLPILEAQQKTCRMEVAATGKGKAFLYFEEGMLIDAHYKGETGENIAAEIAGWSRVKIKFSDLPTKRRKHKVKKSLMDIVGATWQQKAIKDKSGKMVVEENGQSSIEKFSIDTVKEIFQKHILEFKTIKGYLAVGVLDESWEVMDQDAAESEIVFSRYVDSVKKIFSASDESAEQAGLDKCLAFTLHTQKCIVLTIAAGKASKKHFRLIGLCDPSGNWVFMKHKLERLTSHILEILS